MHTSKKFSAARSAVQHGLYTSNLLPTPMNVTSLTSLDPRPKEEEEEKGPGFSRSRMRLIISDLTTQWEGANDAFKVTRSIA